jgi:hypothetical protein
MTMLRIALVIALAAIPSTALAHSWYKDKIDPVYGNSCCGINDCAPWIIQPGELTAEENGFRVRLSLERTKQFNPQSQAPIDALVTWDRVQLSEDGNWHLCLMAVYREGARGGIFCLFQPPDI